MKCNFFGGVFILLIISCNQNKKSVQTTKEAFDKIEDITGVANWQLIDGADTSYLYFSRIGDVHTNIYQFVIVKGDSADTRLNTIVTNNDTVFWKWENKQWYLQAANDSVMEWADAGPKENSAYRFTKKDSSHISYRFPNGHQAVLTKTLPLSSFLVRVKYDYEHGTNFANRDTIFHPHKK